ncbi:LysE family transporter [Fictibacillus sp. BK138]|uniref:LysE family transporter n=1 Tax=Fictibacillus sp. BK138 TaxID=2512121 RepID=UPI001028CE18|nr:LysE family transporter [Fictibacillus sp. BK138]RZT23734.1 threonine/homoserine/homoserine lactone efflux protein [Fictibacillus sp. BK138]
MFLILKYVLLGISLAAPIGPVNAAQMDRGIKYGFWQAWMVGLGATIADGLYMLMVYMGLVSYIDTAFVKTFLWLFGCFVLVYTGFETFNKAAKDARNEKNYTVHAGKSFFAGFLMSLTNPLTILFWLGIYGSILAETAAKYSFESLMLYSGAIFAGILAWDFTMALVSSSFRKLLADRILGAISKLSGLSLIGFGLYFGYQGITFLFF